MGDFEEKKITDLKKSVKIIKDSGTVEFDTEKHVLKILNNIGLTSEKEFFHELIEEYRLKLNEEYKKNIRGHDFIHLLFIYINKIKNNIELSEDMLERSLFQCIDFSELRKERLFVSIEEKYK